MTEKERKHEWYLANRERVKERSRQWRVDNRERYVTQNRRWEELHPETVRAHIRTWRAMNPEKNRAHFTVSNAVRSGKLQREPCEVCGDPRSHAHHEDYSKPLEVQWLCALHHVREHRKAQ